LRVLQGHKILAVRILIPRFIRYDPIEGTASIPLHNARRLSGRQCFIRYDPIEGTASLSRATSVRGLNCVSLGTTRLRVLQDIVFSAINHRIAHVSLGTTRLRVLQDE